MGARTGRKWTATFAYNLEPLNNTRHVLCVSLSLCISVRNTRTQRDLKKRKMRKTDIYLYIHACIHVPGENHWRLKNTNAIFLKQKMKSSFRPRVGWTNIILHHQDKDFESNSRELIIQDHMGDVKLWRERYLGRQIRAWLL